MIEIPEARVLANQINKTLVSKRIKKVIANHSPHKFAWFYQEKPEKYPNLLIDKKIKGASSYNGLIAINVDEVEILLGDGVNIRYFEPNQKIPAKHQLYLEFTDSSKLTFTVQMYGGIWVYNKGEFDNPYFLAAKNITSPLDNAFDFTYFKNIVTNCSNTLSVKAMLATEQRIPGLGNGVLQDILYQAKIHPKRKIGTLGEDDLIRLFTTIKSTLEKMVQNGGRNTEKDLFGNPGNYETLMSKNTVNTECKICGTLITKESYLGGSIYTCGTCQST